MRAIILLEKLIMCHIKNKTSLLKTGDIADDGKLRLALGLIATTVNTINEKQLILEKERKKQL